MTLKQLFEAVTSSIFSFFEMIMQAFSFIFSKPSTIFSKPSTPPPSSYHYSPPVEPEYPPPISPRQTDAIIPAPFFQPEKASVIDMNFSKSFNSALQKTLREAFENNLQKGESIYVNCLWLTTRLDHYLMPQIKTHMDNNNHYFLLVIAQNKEDKEVYRIKDDICEAVKTTHSDRIIVIPLGIVGMELRQELSKNTWNIFKKAFIQRE